jgi:hypothetical protein
MPRLPRSLSCLMLVIFICGCPQVPDRPVLVTQECYLKKGYQQLPRPRLVARRSTFRTRFRELLSGMLIGVGDRLRFNLDGDRGKGRLLHRWARDNGAPVNAQAIWLTRNWDEGWASREDLERLVDEGVVPVLILYYFAGDISRSYVVEHRQEWYFYLMKVAALASIDAPVLVVLEPEFNDGTNAAGTVISNWPGFNEIVIDGIYLLRSMAPNLLVGICPGDFGDEDLEPSMGEIVEYSDFVAFQEMRASTQPSETSEDYEDITDRALGYADYLYTTFDKPVLLAYAAASTHGGWEQVQADVVNHLFAARGELRQRGVFGILYFMLFDDPEHSGYFGPAESEFGLVKANGEPKAGWHAFVEGIGAMAGELAEVK